MSTLGTILASVAGLVMLICHILVIVKMFQNNQTGLGILALVLTCCGLGFLFTFIYGWIKSGEWNLKNVMLAYTVAWVVQIAANIIAPPDYSAFTARFQQQQQQ